VDRSYKANLQKADACGPHPVGLIFCAMKLQAGEKGRFNTSCGQEIVGEVVAVTETGYIVKSDIQSNLHEDGLFRFTFT
jgi:hypothetical protein